MEEPGGCNDGQPQQIQHDRDNVSNNDIDEDIHETLREIAGHMRAGFNNLQAGQNRLAQSVDNLAAQVHPQRQFGFLENNVFYPAIPAGDAQPGPQTGDEEDLQSCVSTQVDPVGDAQDEPETADELNQRLNQIRNHQSTVAQIRDIIALDPFSRNQILNNLDWPRAHTIHYNGNFTVGLWRPIPGWLGYWEYRSRGERSAEDQAMSNLAGHGHWITNDDHPTGMQVHELRLRLRQDPQGLPDVTEGIDLVWVPTHRIAEDDQLGARTRNGSQSRTAQLAHIFLDEHGYDDLNVVSIRAVIEAFLNEVEHLEHEEDLEHTEDSDSDSDVEVEDDIASIGDTIIVRTAPGMQEDVDNQAPGPLEDEYPKGREKLNKQQTQHTKNDPKKQLWWRDFDESVDIKKSMGVAEAPEKNEAAIIAAKNAGKRLTRKNSTAVVDNAPSTAPPSIAPLNAVPSSSGAPANAVLPNVAAPSVAAPNVAPQSIHPDSRPIHRSKSTPRVKPKQGSGSKRPMLPSLLIEENKRAQAREAKAASDAPNTDDDSALPPPRKPRQKTLRTLSDDRRSGADKRPRDQDPDDIQDDEPDEAGSETVHPEPSNRDTKRRRLGSTGVNDAEHGEQNDESEDDGSHAVQRGKAKKNKKKDTEGRKKKR